MVVLLGLGLFVPWVGSKSIGELLLVAIVQRVMAFSSWMANI
jgi:hypothetical protein